MALNKLIERNKKFQYSQVVQRMKKFRLNLIVAKLDANSKIEQDYNKRSQELSLSSSCPIEVMSENKLFEDLGMTDYDEVDLQDMMFDARLQIDSRLGMP